VLDPFIDIARNANFANVPIYKKGNPYTGADVIASQRYWNNTGTMPKSVARMISNLTGGDEGYHPGLLEFEPEVYEYMFQFLGGGAASFVQRTLEVGLPEAMGGKGILWGEMDDISLNDIPFARRMAGNVSERENMGKYMEDRDKYERIRLSMKEAAKEGTEAWNSARDRFGKKYPLSVRLNKIENQRRKLSAQIRKITNAKNMTDEEKKARIKWIREKQQDLIGLANSLVRELED
jgi:hypothetical protein